MPLNAKDEKNYESPKAGLHQAVCAIIEDIGWQKREFNGHEDYGHQIIILWELKSVTTKGNRFKIANFYTLSLNEKSRLRKDLESWLGRNLTGEEIKNGFDVETMLGTNCHLNIKIEDKNGKTKSTIAGISPLMEGLEKITAQSEDVPAWIENIKARGFKEKPNMEQEQEEPIVGNQNSPHDPELPF